MTRAWLTAVLCASAAFSGLAAPVDAGHETGRCGLTEAEVAGSQNHEGVLEAVVTAGPAEQVSVLCSVTVNGTAVVYASGSGVGVAAVAQRVSLAVTATDDVQVCTEITTAHGTGWWCDAHTVLPTTEQVNSAVVGYISMVHTAATGPSYTAAGALADPNLWSCSDAATASGYAVSCVPEQVQALAWRCDVLHADVQTLAAGVTARTSLDCDGGGAEAVTSTVSGATGVDSEWATGNATVTAFTCTIDNGSGLAALPEYRGGCGDPGAPYVE